MISPRDVAEAIYGGEISRKTEEVVREHLKKGTLLPGLPPLSKTGGGYMVPIAAVGTALDRMCEPPDDRPARPAPGQTKVRRTARGALIGPMVFFQAVVDELDALRSEHQRKAISNAIDPSLLEPSPPCPRCGRQHSGKCRMF